MASCPACRRGVAVGRASCLYCGAPLAPDAAAARTPEPVAAPARPDAGRASPPRVLVLLDLASHAADVLAEALELPRYEAALLARRGGIHLVRAAEGPDAEAERGRLAARGARAFAVPEAEVRAAPVRCLGGERREAALLVRTGEGVLTLRGSDLLVVVRGPISREYQTSDARRRGVASARPAEGFRWQLYRRSEPRPLEIDAFNFEVGFAATGSVRLEVDSWIAAVRGEAPLDDGFARVPPALAPAAPDAPGPLAAAGSLNAGRGDGEGRLILDNLAQFRFYAGCVAAVRRRG